MMELFDNFFDSGGLHFLTRYAHVLFGITWIGLLYFFNFVQVPSFAEMEAQARSEALRKITFRALWWFRWAAALTFASGMLMWAIAGDDYNPTTSPAEHHVRVDPRPHDGRQRVDGHLAQPADQHRSAEAVAAGGEADPAAAGAAKLAGRASRVNAFFSIPMVFFMVFTSHFAPSSPTRAVPAWCVDPVHRDLGRRRAECVRQAPGRARQPVLHDGAGRPHQDDRRRPLHRRALLHRLGTDHRMRRAPFTGRP